VIEAKRLVSLGIPGLILFGVPSMKDATGTEAFNPDGIVQVALRSVRDAVGDDLVLMADLCLDEYTITAIAACSARTERSSTPDHQIYGRIAQVQADAGADIVAPSGMMDGQVAAIRAALDSAGHDQIAVLAYASKYAPPSTGRSATRSMCHRRSGDRKAYQQDPRNRRRPSSKSRGPREGADMIMVKPA